MNKAESFITSYKDITSSGLIPLPLNASETNSFFNHQKKEIWSLNAMNERNNEIIYNVWLINEINEKEQCYVTQTKNIPQDIIIGNSNNIFYNMSCNEVFVLSGPRKFSASNEPIQKEEYYLYSYNLNNDSWKLLFQFPKELKFRQIIAIYNNSLIAIAYIKKNKYFLKYELDNNVYSLSEIFAPIPDLGFSTIFVESKIVLYGGIDKNEQCSNKIWFIDPDKFNIIENYSIDNVIPRTFSFSCYMSKHDSIFFYGGTPNGYDFIDSGFLFNTIDKSIKPIDKLFNYDSLFKLNYNDFFQELYLVKCWNFDPELRKYYTRFTEIKRIDFKKNHNMKLVVE